MSVRVKKLKRGASSEADKLLDYLVRSVRLLRSWPLLTHVHHQELGATEAIEKGYLHQLGASGSLSGGRFADLARAVFAIYLDPDEPTNLVESYTFTFSYETDPQGNKVRSEPHSRLRNSLTCPRAETRARRAGPAERHGHIVVDVWAQLA